MTTRNRNPVIVSGSYATEVLVGQIAVVVNHVDGRQTVIFAGSGDQAVDELRKLGLVK